MAEKSTNLAYRLSSFPHIRDALGTEWTTEQERIDPIKSTYPLARWLRMDGFEPDLAVLDSVLGKLAHIPGIADRRRRIRADAPAFAETLTELYFGAWLLELGYGFDWPKQGADFAIHLGAERPLRVEATTPRKAAWLEDLFERLHLVALRTGYSAELEHSQETLPSVALSEVIVADIVQQALRELEPHQNAGQGDVPQPVVQDYPKYGLKVTWMAAASPVISAVTSPGPTSPYTGFSYLVDAAKAKAHQLPENEGGILLVGTQQLPTLTWESFLDALRFYRPEDFPLDWTRVPRNVNHVILYSLVVRKIEPFKAMWIVNPTSPQPDSPGVRTFLQNLFPNPIQPHTER